MRFVVTGSSGFIGKHLSGKLGDSIPFDRFPENAIGYGDITILDDIINASKDCDGIIHLAAISRVSDCEDNPKRCIDVNINGTINVLHAAIKNNINWFIKSWTKRIISYKLPFPTMGRRMLLALLLKDNNCNSE